MSNPERTTPALTVKIRLASDGFYEIGLYSASGLHSLRTAASHTAAHTEADTLAMVTTAFKVPIITCAVCAALAAYAPNAEKG